MTVRACRVEPAVDVRRADHRLERIGEDRGPAKAAALQFPLTEPEVVPEREIRCQLVKALFAHEARAQARKLALPQGLESRVQLGGDDAVEDAVAEELQALVVRSAVAAVRQRLLEQPGIPEAVAQRVLQAVVLHISRRP